jgi:hypothetical protein
MKVHSESITIVPDPRRSELVVILGGFRLTAGAEEARALAAALSRALHRLGAAGAEQAYAVSRAPETAASTPRVQPVAEAPADAAASFRQRLGAFVAAARRVGLDAAGTS